MNLQNHAEWQNQNGMPLIIGHFRFGVFTNFDKKHYMRLLKLFDETFWLVKFHIMKLLLEKKQSNSNTVRMRGQRYISWRNLAIIVDSVIIVSTTSANTILNLYHTYNCISISWSTLDFFWKIAHLIWICLTQKTVIYIPIRGLLQTDI